MKEQREPCLNGKDGDHEKNSDHIFLHLRHVVLDRFVVQRSEAMMLELVISDKLHISNRPHHMQTHYKLTFTKC